MNYYPTTAFLDGLDGLTSFVFTPDELGTYAIQVRFWLTSYEDTSLTVDFVTYQVVDDIDCSTSNSFVMDESSVDTFSISGSVETGITYEIVYPTINYQKAVYYGDLGVCGPITIYISSITY